MRRTLPLIVLLCLVATAFAQTSATTPKISQLFAFSCNSNYSSCPYGMDPVLSPIQLSTEISMVLHGGPGRTMPTLEARYGKSLQREPLRWCIRSFPTAQASSPRVKIR